MWHPREKVFHFFPHGKIPAGIKIITWSLNTQSHFYQEAGGSNLFMREDCAEGCASQWPSLERCPSTPAPAPQQAITLVGWIQNRKIQQLFCSSFHLAQLARFSQTPLSGALHSWSYADNACQPAEMGESAWSGMPHHFCLHPHLKVEPFRHEMCFTFVWPLPFSACSDVTAVSAHFVLSAQALKHCSYLHLFLPWNVTA